MLKNHLLEIGVFVNRDNPISELSLDELDAIYSDARRRGFPADIAIWGQLGLTGDWEDKPIHPYGFYWRDEITWHFRHLVSYGAPFKTAYRVPPGDISRQTPVVAKDLMNTLAQDRYAIGFANFFDETDQVKALGHRLINRIQILAEASLTRAR